MQLVFGAFNEVLVYEGLREIVVDTVASLGIPIVAVHDSFCVIHFNPKVEVCSQ